MGFGKRSLDGFMIEEANKLVSHIESLEGVTTVNSTLFTVPILNVLWNMIIGYPLPRDDSNINKILDNVNFIFTSKIFVLATTAPWIRFFFPSLTGYNRRLKALEFMREYMRSEIEKHEKELDEENPKDFIDSYLIEIKNNPDPEFCKDQLIMIGFDLIGAGSETSSTTLTWSLMYLALHPEVQEKCFKEIDNHLGIADVGLADMDELQYCQATIAEIQRVSQVAISTLQHRVVQDVIQREVSYPS